MKHAQVTTVLTFNFASPFDTDMKVGSSHVFAHANTLDTVATRDRVLIAGIDLPSPTNGLIDPKRHFWLLFCKLVSACPEELMIRVLLVYEKLLLSEIDSAGAHAL